MPRYFFHLHNDFEVEDDEGRELPDLETAKSEARRAARDLIAESAKEGRITLSHSVEIRDGCGARLATLRFADAVEIID